MNVDGQQYWETDFYALLNLSLHEVSALKISGIQYEGLVMSITVLHKISSNNWCVTQQQQKRFTTS